MRKKKCPKCGKIKSTSRFYKEASRCIQCYKKYWNPERAKRKRERYSTDLRYKEAQQKWARDYYWKKRGLGYIIPIREKILKRDNYQCGLCQRKEVRLTLHHIDDNKENNNFDNLIILCWNCHSGIHRLKKLPLTDSTKIRLLKLLGF